MTQTADGVGLALTDAAIADKVRHAVGQSIEVLNRRINAMGTKETVIQQQGPNRVLIEAPGSQDTTTLKNMIGQTAKLEFRLVADPGDPPNEAETLPMQKGGGTIQVQKRVMVDGEDLVDAQQSFDQQTGEPDVSFRFNLRGGQRFGQVTSANVGRPFAIVLDGKVISAPVIRSPITGGTGQITGNFSLEEASSLAILLRAGALPAKLTVIEERTVGPGLGAGFDRRWETRSLCRRGARRHLHDRDLRNFRRFRRSRARGAHSVYLRFDGPARRDADPAGIAGIVFTIGMAVDSNVLIYERIPRRPISAARSFPRSTPVSAGPLRPSSIPTSPCSSRRSSSICSARALCGASPSRWAWHSDLGHHRGHHDAHDDRALVSPRAAEDLADMSAAMRNSDLAV